MNIVKVLAAVEMLDKLGLELILAPFSLKGQSAIAAPTTKPLADVDLYILKRGVDALERMHRDGEGTYPDTLILVGGVLLTLSAADDPQLWKSSGMVDDNALVYRVIDKQRSSSSSSTPYSRLEILYKAKRALLDPEYAKKLIIEYSRVYTLAADEFLGSTGLELAAYSAERVVDGVGQIQSINAALQGVSENALYGLYLYGVVWLGLKPESGRLTLTIPSADPETEGSVWYLSKNLDTIRLELIEDGSVSLSRHDTLCIQPVIMSNQQSDTGSYKDESLADRATAALETIRRSGFDVHTLSDASIPVFEYIPHDIFGRDIVKDLYWLITDKEHIPRNGAAGQNYPCGVVIGCCIYARVDYCWDEEVVKINICDYHSVMDLPLNRRLYVGSKPLKERDIVGSRIRKLTTK